MIPPEHSGFSFPTNNPLLTAITDLSGTYTGTTVTVSATHPRQYNVDIAQDESGKLSAMGTVERDYSQRRHRQ